MTEQDRLTFWTKALNLPGFRVVHERRDTPTDPLRLTVVPDLPLGLCPHCRRATDAVHRTHESAAVKDLPLGPQTLELVVRTYQFHCPHCDSYFTPRAVVFAAGVHATERFLEQAARLIRISDVANAAAFLGVPEKTLERWYHDYAERQTQTPVVGLQPILSVGIDELSLKKSTGSSSL
jgi:transposase